MTTPNLFEIEKYKGKKFIIYLERVEEEKYVFSCFVCGKKNYIIATIDVCKTKIDMYYNQEEIYDFIRRKALKEWKIVKKRKPKRK